MDFASAPEKSSTRRLMVLYASEIGTSDYIGEPVSIVQHSLQAAHHARLFYSSKCEVMDEEVVIASLLHDIGHLIGLEAGEQNSMGGCGIMDHESLGGSFLRKLGFSSRVAKLVENHVTAKRYLCWKYPDYCAKLSEASRTTLEYQGGVLTAQSAALFEKDPDFEIILKMREWDELAKDPDLSVAPFSAYLEMLSKNSSPHGKEQHYFLSQPQIDFYKKNSYLKLSNLLDFHTIKAEVPKHKSTTFIPTCLSITFYISYYVQFS